MNTQPRARPIYNRDPDAGERLTARLHDLLARRKAIHEYHRTCRAGEPDPSLLLPQEQATLERLKNTQQWKIAPCGLFPAYVTKNITRTIGVTRGRLAALPERKR